MSWDVYSCRHQAHFSPINNFPMIFDFLSFRQISKIKMDIECEGMLEMVLEWLWMYCREASIICMEKQHAIPEYAERELYCMDFKLPWIG